MVKDKIIELYKQLNQTLQDFTLQAVPNLEKATEEEKQFVDFVAQLQDQIGDQLDDVIDQSEDQE
ncbi:MAG: hypothetical protein MJZ69_00865 [Bacteroidaceae bacterium]|nr:hypothetical protein [Bacteroidaceae bacterium]MDO4957227.1 hypothetical protein [Bacteroidales bacterium]